VQRFFISLRFLGRVDVSQNIRLFPTISTPHPSQLLLIGKRFFLPLIVTSYQIDLRIARFFNDVRLVTKNLYLHATQFSGREECYKNIHSTAML